MIPCECKRLAEVDFPVAVVSKHAARRSRSATAIPRRCISGGCRPLASSRAVLLALLLPHPCGPHCSEEFRLQAKEVPRGSEAKRLLDAMLLAVPR